MEPHKDLSEALTEAADLIRDNWAKFPPRLRQAIRRFDGPGVSPVDKVVGLLEAFYSFRKKAGTGVNTLAAKRVIGRLAGFVAANGLHQERGDRAERIRAAMMRDVGDVPAGETAQDARDDPAPLRDVTEDQPDPGAATSPFRNLAPNPPLPEPVP